jgi:hypothetical protein
MTTDTKRLWLAPAVVLAALCALATIARSPLAQGTRTPEQHVASIKESQRQTVDYLNRLSAAVQAEKRDDGWAAQKEAALRTSFDAERSLPRDALKSVECRSSKCSMQISLSTEGSPGAVVEQQAAIDHWISASQPCAYTMTNPAAASQPMLIFLDCKR